MSAKTSQNNSNTNNICDNSSDNSNNNNKICDNSKNNNAVSRYINDSISKKNVATSIKFYCCFPPHKPHSEMAAVDNKNKSKQQTWCQTLSATPLLSGSATLVCEKLLQRTLLPLPLLPVAARLTVCHQLPFACLWFVRSHCSLAHWYCHDLLWQLSCFACQLLSLPQIVFLLALLLLPLLWAHYWSP